MNSRKASFIAVVILTFLFAATARAEVFIAYLNGAQQVPAAATSATGYARVIVNEQAGTLTFTVVFNNLTSAQTLSHIHAPGAIGVNAAVVIDFGAVGGTSGTISGTRSITPTQLAQIRAHQGYVNVHSVNFPNGEIRGQLGIQRPVDYDGDGKQDLSVLRFPNIAPPGVAQITYYNNNSTSGPEVKFWGDVNKDFPAPGDYDGDGKGDVAIYRDGATTGGQSEFWVMNSSDNTANRYFFGVTGDEAVQRDYDGDGKTDLAVFRRGVNEGDPAFWYIFQSSNGQFRITQFGTTGNVGDNSSGDTPAPGDYDGDGKFDLSLYRFGFTGNPSNNSFIVLRSSDNVTTYTPWGNFNSDYVLPGDYDGDGKYDYCVARTGATATSPMVWWVLKSSNGQVQAQTFGFSADLPTQGDYDGDARTDFSVYRNGATTGSDSFFWYFSSMANNGVGTHWGIRGDFPPATYDAR
jgi:CHRD domain/FG-GAP-like repeat